MDPWAQAYDDFVPPTDLMREAGADTLVIDLSGTGFRKEHIKVQIDNYGRLRISGECPLAGNRWSRFLKEFQVHENCNVSDIRARFVNGVVRVTLPRLITHDDQPVLPAKEKGMMDPKPPTSINQYGTAGEKASSSQQQDEKRNEPTDHDAKDQSSNQEAVKKEREEKKKQKAAAAKEGLEDDSQQETRSSEEYSRQKDRDDKEEKDGCGNPEAIRASGYSFLRNPRRFIWTMLAVVLVLVVVGLFANYKFMKPTTEPADGGSSFSDY